MTAPKERLHVAGRKQVFEVTPSRDQKSLGDFQVHIWPRLSAVGGRRSPGTRQPLLGYESLTGHQHPNTAPTPATSSPCLNLGE